MTRPILENCPDDHPREVNAAYTNERHRTYCSSCFLVDGGSNDPNRHPDLRSYTLVTPGGNMIQRMVFGPLRKPPTEPDETIGCGMTFCHPFEGNALLRDRIKETTFRHGYPWLRIDREDIPLVVKALLDIYEHPPEKTPDAPAAPTPE